MTTSNPPVSEKVSPVLSTIPDNPSPPGVSKELTQDKDVFVERPDHDIHYKTLSWQFVSLLMIAEIVSNGMLSLPSALAVVGIVPGVILIIFLGIFGLFTAKLLIDFKLNHPSVHNMGDAGYLLGGPVARELLSSGTIIFAVCATGSVILSGQQALSTLSNDGLCTVYFVAIFSVATFFVALPRTLDRLSWLGLASVLLITLSAIIAMLGAGLNPVPGCVLSATLNTNFYQAFLAITNPVFSYAGKNEFFIPSAPDNVEGKVILSSSSFFILISEMQKPHDAMKAACVLQGFATVLYAVFAIVMYISIGNTIASPAFFSLPPVWAKASFGIALTNFLIAAGIYSHTAAKLIFIRFFRHSRHMYTHTVLGWSIWTGLCIAAVATAFVLAVAVPIFSYLIGIIASLFAAWYTYGLAGFFWIHDTYHLKGGRGGLLRHPVMLVLSILTIIAGAFICIAGTYVSVKLINDAYREGLVGKPFTC